VYEGVISCGCSARIYCTCRVPHGQQRSSAAYALEGSVSADSPQSRKVFTAP
jgi:hypothetical protein